MKHYKKILPALFIVLSLGMISCSDSKKDGQGDLLTPGTVIAEVKEQITEDTLNDFTFSLRVTADSNVTAGVYDVEVKFANNFATNAFTMPKGIEDVVPTIRKGNTKYSYIAGFQLAGDTTFYDYFEISASFDAIRMKYIKSYSFEDGSK